eukprot:4605572-Amphidinium_carterae.1
MVVESFLAIPFSLATLSLLWAGPGPSEMERLLRILELIYPYRDCYFLVNWIFSEPSWCVFTSNGIQNIGECPIQDEYKQTLKQLLKSLSKQLDVYE